MRRATALLCMVEYSTENASGFGEAIYTDDARLSSRAVWTLSISNWQSVFQHESVIGLEELKSRGFAACMWLLLMRGRSHPQLSETGNCGVSRVQSPDTDTDTDTQTHTPSAYSCEQVRTSASVGCRLSRVQQPINSHL